MKTLLMLFVLASSVFADTEWTHKNAEGQGGGLAADYVFYKAAMQKAGDHIMSVQKVRAVYAYNDPHQKILVAEYEYKNGLHISIKEATSENLQELSQGEDVKAKVIREYTLEYEVARGAMSVLKIKKPLTVEQQNDLYNLSVLMMLERWPIKQQANKAQMATPRKPSD